MEDNKVNSINNPFEYEAAVKFKTDELIEYFVEDYNYSRFIQSSRNVFLIGERGCGKSMTLLYNSYHIQKRKTEKNNNQFDFKKIGVYVPCTNPLFFKQEYDLVTDPFKVAVLSEHFFVLAIAYDLCEVLMEASKGVIDDAEPQIRKELEYILNISLLDNVPVFEALSLYFQKINTESQEDIQNREDSFTDKCVSFYSLIIPLLRIVRKVPLFENSHFLFLIDDGHDLNIHQIKTLNSWIAYRDHSYFSFKVAIAKIRKHTYITASGGSILEGHDYLHIDMEKPFQNKFSDFGQWAKGIVERRLEKFGIKDPSVESYFPLNKDVEAELDKCEMIVRKRAEEKYKDEPEDKRQKKITDYVYKQKRAEYFRSRPAKANLPQYSGWETIVHLSTGVIRNLLYPCYWMYDKEYSSHVQNEKKSKSLVESIRSSTQDLIIKEKSQELWDRINDDLFNNIDNCSSQQAVHVKNLFEHLALLFKERLLSDSSEPRAITFSISGQKDIAENELNELMELLRISKEAQILYDRISTAKDQGKREVYYVPNRLLLPIRGLDVVGQHARVSIKAIELYYAATKEKKINAVDVTQQTLFDYE